MSIEINNEIFIDEEEVISSAHPEIRYEATPYLWIDEFALWIKDESDERKNEKIFLKGMCEVPYHARDKMYQYRHDGGGGVIEIDTVFSSQYLTFNGKDSGAFEQCKINAVSLNFVTLYYKKSDILELCEKYGLDYFSPSDVNKLSSPSETTSDKQPLERTLTETERKTLLRILLGIAIDSYNYDPNASRNTATGENKGSISAALQRLKLDTDPDTIRKYLSEAAAIFWEEANKG